MMVNNVFLNKYDVTFYEGEDYCVESLFAPNGAFARRLVLKHHPGAKIVDCHLTGDYKEEPDHAGQK